MLFRSVRVTKSELTIKAAREVFATLLKEWEEQEVAPSAERIEAIIKERGLATVNDTGAIESVVMAVIGRNEKAVADLRAGKMQAIGAIVGQVMKELKGADAKVVRQMILDKVGIS